MDIEKFVERYQLYLRYDWMSKLQEQVWMFLETIFSEEYQAFMRGECK